MVETLTKDHPVYAAALANDEGRAWRWIDTAAVARLIRDHLARTFPGVKFYVRSERYSGGSSINVHYAGVVLNDRGNEVLVRKDYDGNVLDPTPVENPDYSTGHFGFLPLPGAPTKRDVENALGGYSGQRFDGMIDMAYSVTSWLNPDGTAEVAHNPGTGGQKGSDPGYSAPAPSDRSIAVHFGASYVFVNDSLPYETRAKAAGR